MARHSRSCWATTFLLAVGSIPKRLGTSEFSLAATLLARTTDAMVSPAARNSLMDKSPYCAVFVAWVIMATMYLPLRFNQRTTRCSVVAPRTALIGIRWSSVTSLPWFLTARAKRYKSVNCLAL